MYKALMLLDPMILWKGYYDNLLSVSAYQQMYSPSKQSPTLSSHWLLKSLEQLENESHVELVFACIDPTVERLNLSLHLQCLGIAKGIENKLRSLSLIMFKLFCIPRKDIVSLKNWEGHKQYIFSCKSMMRLPKCWIWQKNLGMAIEGKRFKKYAHTLTLLILCKKRHSWLGLSCIWACICVCIPQHTVKQRKLPSQTDWS